MAFLWDPAKAQDNFRKHHVLFADAAYAFDDPLRMIRRDNDSSEDEYRWQTIGNAMGHLLFVVYTHFIHISGIMTPGLYRPDWLRQKRGGPIMAMVRHIHKVGSELTFEERAAIQERLEEAAKSPISYDRDCPELTDEQLAEFRPVSDMTMEERTRAIRTAEAVSNT
jgi:uncharacterized DUF497 family protein